MYGRKVSLFYNSEEARLAARILIATYEGGLAENARFMQFMRQDNMKVYLPAVRENIEEEMFQSRKLAVSLKEAMLAHARASTRLDPVNIDGCICEMTEKHTIPQKYFDLGNIIGEHFRDQWMKLAELYIEAIKTVGRNVEVLKILDAELKTHSHSGYRA